METMFLDLTTHWIGFTALTIFVISYLFVMGEEFLHLRKSKPVLVGAGFIWVLIAIFYAGRGDYHTAEIAVRQNILEFAELFLFLLSAMTYVNTMEERRIFDFVRAWLLNRGFSLKVVFWITGLLAFSLSPVIDNLTTALVIGAVVLAMGKGKRGFIVVGCINVVVAANAGGAFSPFGDITTLMVWQKGMVKFSEFFVLFLPALVNWFVPAFIMSFAVEKGNPLPVKENVTLRPGAIVVVWLFIVTIAITVALHNFLHLPPVIGMMIGLGFLKIYGYFLKRFSSNGIPHAVLSEFEDAVPQPEEPFDIFKSLQKAEWDTLMFFYGIILSVGGLGTLGYLKLISKWLYDGFGPTIANLFIGIISSVVDNIPVMFAVLSMNPEMSHSQWLLVTLTAGVGGSLLSIGSAAGVALMGQARGVYTFFSHLKWTWAIALGYAASVLIHIFMNIR